MLLLLFISYYGSITLFWHSHKLGYTTIFHSHPFGNPNHTHTTAQYDLIKVLSETAGFVTVTGLSVWAAIEGRSNLLVAKPVASIPQNQAIIYFRRGPPIRLAS
jgi:hypothetical protein